jgi:hypothetical protein
MQHTRNRVIRRDATTIKIAGRHPCLNTVSRCIEELSMPPAGRAPLDARDGGRMKQHWRVLLRTGVLALLHRQIWRELPDGR